MFFLFKQKTAYEMRISDWSSDVCSSDLAVGIDGGTAQALLAELQLTDALCVAGFNSSRGATLAGDPRSDERRGGKECVSTCRSRWSPDQSKKTYIYVTMTTLHQYYPDNTTRVEIYEHMIS